MSLRTVGALAAALGCLAATRLVHDAAASQRDAWPHQIDLPYAPSPGAAPYVSLGYRELGADLMWIRALSYFGGKDDTAEGLEGLIDALLALDPTFERACEWAPRAIGWVDHGATNDDHLWAARLLESCIPRSPQRYELPYLAGQVYALDLETEDKAQRAAWDARAAELLDHAMRMPGAPRNMATLVANLRTGLGQQERATRDLLELIATTDDAATRKELTAKLAKLQGQDADRIEFEMEATRAAFRRAWKAALPEAPEAMYILVGDPPPPWFDLGDLAVEPSLPPPLPAYEPPLED